MRSHVVIKLKLKSKPFMFSKRIFLQSALVYINTVRKQ